MENIDYSLLIVTAFHLHFFFRLNPCYNPEFWQEVWKHNDYKEIIVQPVYCGVDFGTTNPSVVGGNGNKAQALVLAP